MELAVTTASTFSLFLGTTATFNDTATSFSIVTENVTVVGEAKGCIFVDSSANISSSTDEGFSSQITNVFMAVRGTVVFPLLFFVGVPGNCLNMLVFYRQDLRQRINLCLFTLALVDLCSLSLVFFYYADNLRIGALESSAFFRETGPFKKFITQYHLMGAYGFLWTSMFVSAVIASERCFCVMWPLRAKGLMQTRTMAVILATGILSILTATWAITEKYGLGCIYDVATASRMIVMVDTPYYLKHRELVDFIDGVLYGIVIPGTCCTVVFVSTLITAVKLRATTKWRQESSVSAAALSPPEVALTYMLIAVSVQFLVFNLPNIFFRLCIVLVPDLKYSGRLGSLFIFLVGVAEVCAGINSSTNIIVYCFTSTKYRRTLKDLLPFASHRAKMLLQVTAPSQTPATSH